MEAVQIKVNKKNRPFLISYRAAKDLATIEVDDPEITTRNSGFDYQELMMFLGFKYGAISEKKEIDFTQENVVEWIDADIDLFPVLVEHIKNMSKAVTGKLTGAKK